MILSMRLNALETATELAAPGWGLTQPWATVIGAIGVVIAGLFAFLVAYFNRRQTERHWRTTNRQERFTTIATQLADPAAAIRLAGVYAMEALIDDWLKPRPLPWIKRLNAKATWTSDARRKTREILTQRSRRQAQACINVLCAYLRLPQPTTPAAANTFAPVPTSGDEEIRKSILTTMGSHLAENPAGESWRDLDYDLSNATLHEFTQFNGATICGTANFANTTFSGVTSFSETHFGGVAMFQGSSFPDRTFFDGAEFYSIAYFRKAQFTGSTSFSDVKFHNVTVFDEINFGGTTEFTGTEFIGETTFWTPTAWNVVITDWRSNPGGQPESVMPNPKKNGLFWPPPVEPEQSE